MAERDDTVAFARDRRRPAVRTISVALREWWELGTAAPIS